MNKQSGVAARHYNKYEFKDHIWSMNTPQELDLLELAERCVKVDGCYYLKQPGLGHWVPYQAMIDAIKEAGNTWIGGRLRSGKVVDLDLIETFFKGNKEIVVGKRVVSEYVGSCPNIQHTMVIPMGPQYVIHDSKKYLNLWKDDMITARADKAALGKLVLEMIYRSLCNGAQLHQDKGDESTILLEQVINNKYQNDDFRLCMNWLAAIYQMPGINLQTNLWFCGEQQGVGKGTLVDIMNRVLGSTYVGALNQTEIEAGWNDHIMGKLLVSVNEFDSSGKMSGKAWNKWIKDNTCDESVKIRQRNFTAKNVLNISNYIFTSNDENPIYLDKTDRRNHLIKTTDDPYWKEFAAVIKTRYVTVDVEAIAAGFAWVLEQVKVDIQFVNTSFVNSLKASILASSLNHVEEWLTSDPLIVRGKAKMARTLYSDFKTWMYESKPGTIPESETMFGRLMKKAESLGVASKRDKTGMTYVIGDIEDAAKVDRAGVARDVGGVTGDSLSIQDHDVAIERLVAPQLNKLELMRAAIRRMDADNEYGFDRH